MRILVKLLIKTEAIELFKEKFLAFMEETRKESGCISFQLFQDTGNPQVFFVSEEWESKEAVDKHMKSAHFLAMQEVEKGIRDGFEFHALELVK